VSGSETDKVKTHGSVVVSMFFMTDFVNPSTSSGCFFLAIRERDLEMIFRPFLCPVDEPLRTAFVRPSSLKCLIRHVREHNLL
jgi:hypothetical protein